MQKLRHQVVKAEVLRVKSEAIQSCRFHIPEQNPGCAPVQLSTSTVRRLWSISSKETLK